MTLRFDDDFEHGFAWSLEGERLPRTSHALLADGRVWVIDAVDGEGLDERIVRLGEPAAVVQLLDRHNRDCAVVAERLGVPLRFVPFEARDGDPFLPLRIVRWRLWREIAVWFAEEQTIVFADALGSLGYFKASGEPFGVHPALRPLPPRKALASLEPQHVLFGHGAGFHGPEAPEALRAALETARRRIPQAYLATVRSVVRR